MSVFDNSTVILMRTRSYGQATLELEFKRFSGQQAGQTDKTTPGTKFWDNATIVLCYDDGTIDAGAQIGEQRPQILKDGSQVGYYALVKFKLPPDVEEKCKTGQLVAKVKVGNDFHPNLNKVPLF